MIGWVVAAWAQDGLDLGAWIDRDREIERIEALLAGPEGNRAASLWLALAVEYDAAGRWDEAVAATRSAVAVATGAMRVDALEALATRQVQLRDPGAVATWKRAIAQPSSPERRGALLAAMMGAAAEDPQNLGSYLRTEAPEAVRRDTALVVGAWCALGDAYARRGRLAEAEEAYAAGLTRAPGTEAAVPCAIGQLARTPEAEREAAIDAVFAAFPGPYAATERTALADHLLGQLMLAEQQGRTEAARRWADAWSARFPLSYRAPEVEAARARLE